jgi:tetratricopeptide (TPR) repeat protein
VGKHRRGHSFSGMKHTPRFAPRRQAAGPLSGGTVKSRSAELRLGFDAFAQGDYGQAIQAWKRVQRAGAPAGLAAALAEAYFRRALGAANEARRVQALSEAVQLAPDRALYHFHLGLAYFRNGQLRRALTALESAHHLDPENGRFHHHLVLFALADPSTTPGGLAFVQSTVFSDEAALRLHALAELRQGEPISAIPAMATLTKPSALACVSLGLAQLAAGRPRDALAQLQELPHTPISSELRHAAAIGGMAARLQLGDAPAAFSVLRQLSVPDEPGLRAAFGAVARRLVEGLVLDERIGEAVLAGQQVLAAGSDSAPLTALLSHLHEVLATRAAQHGDFVTAAEHWEAALLGDSANPRILRNLALVEEKLERWEPASHHWEALLHLWKKELRSRDGASRASAEFRLQLGVVYRHLASTFEAAGDVHAAVRSLENALNFDASQVDLHLRAADLYMDAEDYAKAIEHLRRALSANPNDTRALAALGSSYNLKGDDRQAEAYLNQALALEPENEAVKCGLAGVHHERGHRLLQGGQAERAADEFWKAVNLDRSTDEHLVCLGKAYLKLGWFQAARKAFSVSLTASSDPIETRLRVGSAYLAGGYEPEAARTFRQALRISRTPGVRVAVGHAYMQHGRSEAADEQFQQVRKSRDPRANAAIGRLFIGAAREKEAIPYLERAVFLDPLDPSIFLDLAYAVAFGQEDFARASAELTNAQRAANLSGEDKLLPEIESARRILDEVTAPTQRGWRGKERW